MKSKFKLQYIVMLTGVFWGISIYLITKVNKYKKNAEKNVRLYRLMNRWVQIKQEGKKISDYFSDNSYKSVAIYGMGYAGERLLDDLKEEGIFVKYVMDQRANQIVTSVELYTLEDELPKVDTIIITSIADYNEIKEKLLRKVNCSIVSIEEILFEL